MNDIRLRDINIKRSEEYEELMGKIPPIFLRWGILVIFSIFIFFIGAFSIIDYQDTIRGEVELNKWNNDFVIYIYVDENDWRFIKNGQKVIIHLNSYPETEYGIIYGSITLENNSSLTNGLYKIKIETTSNFNDFNNFFNSDTHKGLGDIIINTTTVLSKILQF